MNTSTVNKKEAQFKIIIYPYPDNGKPSLT
jgi:hypothetical protein